MIRIRAAIAAALVVPLAACGYEGPQSLPLPGGVGRDGYEVTVVPGHVDRRPDMDFQNANVIDALEVPTSNTEEMAGELLREAAGVARFVGRGVYAARDRVFRLSPSRRVGPCSSACAACAGGSGVFG